MQNQIKWMMGILAALFVSGATAWAASIESRFADIDAKMESLIRLEVMMQQTQRDVSEIKGKLNDR